MNPDPPCLPPVVCTEHILFESVIQGFIIMLAFWVWFTLGVRPRIPVE